MKSFSKEEPAFAKPLRQLLAFLALAVVGAALAGAPAAHAQTSVPIAFPDRAGLRVGDTLRVPVRVGAEIGAESNVRAFEATVTFDPEVVQFSGEAVKEGTLSETFSVVGAEVPRAGEVRVAGFRGTGTILTGGPGPLVFLEAVVRGEGTSPLTVEAFLFNEGDPRTEATSGSITAGR